MRKALRTARRKSSRGSLSLSDNAGIYKEIFQEWIDKYYTADFVSGRDGGIEEEHKVLVEWAKKTRNKF